MDCQAAPPSPGAVFFVPLWRPFLPKTRILGSVQRQRRPFLPKSRFLGSVQRQRRPFLPKTLFLGSVRGQRSNNWREGKGTLPKDSAHFVRFGPSHRLLRPLRELVSGGPLPLYSSGGGQAFGSVPFPFRQHSGTQIHQNDPILQISVPGGTQIPKNSQILRISVPVWLIIGLAGRRLLFVRDRYYVRDVCVSLRLYTKGEQRVLQ